MSREDLSRGGLDFESTVCDLQPVRCPEVFTSPDQIKVGDGDVVVFEKRMSQPFIVTVTEIDEKEIHFTKPNYFGDFIKGRGYLSDCGLVPYLNGKWNIHNFVRRLTDAEENGQPLS